MQVDSTFESTNYFIVQMNSCSTDNGSAKKRVNIVGNQPKRGVFFSKDKRMLELQEENQQLQAQLGIEMSEFQHISRELQHVTSQEASIANENSLMEIEIMMLKKDLQGLSLTWEKTNPQIVELQQLHQEETEMYKRTQEELSESIKREQQLTNKIRRYKDELKVEKMMVQSDKNMNNVKKSMQSTHQNQLKHNDILKSKLQSKQRYLKVLQKKLQKQAEKEKEDEKTEKRMGTAKGRYRPVGCGLSKYASEKALAQSTSNSNKKRQVKEMKGYNDLIRKKNAILNGRK